MTNVVAPTRRRGRRRRRTLRRPKRRTERSLTVRPPSLKTGWVKVFVVTISMTRPARVGGLLEPPSTLLPGRVVGVEREHVVVVEGDPPGAELGQALGVLPRVEGRAAGRAERVGARPADGPEAEGEPVFGARCAHHLPPSQ